jgi:beta-xylosidase
MLIVGKIMRGLRDTKLKLGLWLLLAPLAQAIWNPIISGFNPDPAILRRGKDYFIACSSFEYFPGLPIYHSKPWPEHAPISSFDGC